MIARVRFARLDRLRVGGRFRTPEIDAQELAAIRRSIAVTLDI